MAVTTFRSQVSGEPEVPYGIITGLYGLGEKHRASPIPNTIARASTGIRLDELPAEIIELIAFFLARHDIVEDRFKYTFLRGVFNLRLSCRSIAFKLDTFYRRRFETINIELSCDGLQRALSISQAPELATRVRCVRLRYNLIVPGEDELLDNMREAATSPGIDTWWPILACRRREAIHRACIFNAGFGRIYLSRAFSGFKHLSEIRLPLEDKQWEPMDIIDPAKSLLDTILNTTISALDIAKRKIRVLGFADDFDIMMSLGASLTCWGTIPRNSRALRGLTTLEMAIDRSNGSQRQWGGWFLQNLNSVHFPYLQTISLYADFSSRYGASMIGAPIYQHYQWPSTVRNLSLDGFRIRVLIDDRTRLPFPEKLDELSIRNCRFTQGEPLEYLTSYVTTSGLKKLFLSQIGFQATRISFEGFPYFKEVDPLLNYEQWREASGDDDAMETAAILQEYVWIENNKYELEINGVSDDMEEMLQHFRQCWKVQNGLSVQSSSEFNFWWNPADVPIQTLP